MIGKFHGASKSHPKKLIEIQDKKSKLSGMNIVDPKASYQSVEIKGAIGNGRGGYIN